MDIAVEMTTATTRDMMMGLKRAMPTDIMRDMARDTEMDIERVIVMVIGLEQQYGS